MFLLKQSPGLGDLMVKIVAQLGKNLAEISETFRKEFMLKTIIHLKSVGRKKEAVEFLMDTRHGPSVITDDCKYFFGSRKPGCSK